MFDYCKYFFYSKSYDDLTSQNSELTLRLRQKTVDFTTLSESSKSISNQLEMSQILVQQVFTNYPFNITFRLILNQSSLKNIFLNTIL